MHPSVRPILWSNAARTMNLPVDDDIKDASIILPTQNKDCNPCIFAGYRAMALHHNKLVDLMDELLHHEPHPSIDMYNDQSLDPRVRLTTAAVKLLREEAKDLEQSLYRARVELRLRKNAQDVQVS